MDLRELTLNLPKASSKSPEIASNLEELVDGKVSCTMCFECIRPPAHHSGLCKLHLDRVLAVANSPDFSARASLTVPPSDNIQFFMRDDNDNRDLFISIPSRMEHLGKLRVKVLFRLGACSPKQRPKSLRRWSRWKVDCGASEAAQGQGF